MWVGITPYTIKVRSGDLPGLHPNKKQVFFPARQVVRFYVEIRVCDASTRRVFLFLSMREPPPNFGWPLSEKGARSKKEQVFHFRWTGHRLLRMVMSLGMSPAIGQRLLGGQQGGGPFMGRDFMGQSAPPMSQALKQQVDDEARTNLGECGGPRDKRPRASHPMGECNMMVAWSKLPFCMRESNI